MRLSVCVLVCLLAVYYGMAALTRGAPSQRKLGVVPPTKLERVQMAEPISFLYIRSAEWFDRHVPWHR